MLALFAAAIALGPATQISIDPTFSIGTRNNRRAVARVSNESSWIWSSETRDNQTVTLSKRFTLSHSPHDANLYITVDNSYSLSIDGKPVGKTEMKSGDSEEWRTAQKYDVASLLTPGAHKIEITAFNSAGPAGALVRLEVDGKPVLVSDASWQAADLTSPGTTLPATVIGVGGSGPWGESIGNWPVGFNTDVPYLYHLSMKPIKVADVDENSDPDHLTWRPASSELSLKSLHPGKPWRVVIDFGQELSGRFEASSKALTSFTAGTGESTGEALFKPYTSVDLTLAPGENRFTRYSAFRYVRLDFPATETQADLQTHLDHLYYPVTYRGKFDCSDPLLTKIWYTGAYTAHLSMQQDIWDAPKRDRARWMGDLHVSGEVINNVFADRFLMEQTMRRLRADAQGGQPVGSAPSSHVNGIPGYSCAWVAGLADFYRHTGDLAYIKSEQENIVTMLDFFKGELDENGLFADKRGEWDYVDWSQDFASDTPETRATTHFFLVKAVREGAYLLREIGDGSDATRFEAWADTLTDAAHHGLRNASSTYGTRRQENAMAVFSGVATPQDDLAIYNEVLRPGTAAWKFDATPYYNNYVIFALSELGHTQDAMDFVRNYWGGMIREGATTFWEGYDESWDKHNFHSHLQADNGTGYFVSLCHGWSAGVTNWLTEEVLGVRSTGAGFKDCDIDPDLGDLQWASGTVPTPSGDIQLSVQRSGDQYVVNVQIPRGVQRATVKVKGAALKVDKGHAPLSETQNNQLVLGPGSYRLKS